MTSGESSVSFLRRGTAWAIWKSEGMQPVVRGELMREERNERRSPDMVWRREDGWVRGGRLSGGRNSLVAAFHMERERERERGQGVV